MAASDGFGEEQTVAGSTNAACGVGGTVEAKEDQEESKTAGKGTSLVLKELRSHPCLPVARNPRKALISRSPHRWGGGEGQL